MRSLCLTDCTCFEQHSSRAVVLLVADAAQKRTRSIEADCFVYTFAYIKPFGLMAEQATVGQRFVQLIAHLGISKNAFANSLDKTATVIQHLVEERNKPGFDLLYKVFEIYPNVSKDWLIQGTGPMLISEIQEPATPPPAGSGAGTPAETTRTLGAPAAPVAAESVATPAEPVAAVVAAAPEQVLSPASAAPIEAPVPAAAAMPLMPPVAPAPVAVAAPAPEAAWQTALYTQQMAHQLAMAELRNQHLQDQQRLMQQMLDLMQRKLS